jgi:hypothetical protein
MELINEVFENRRNWSNDLKFLIHNINHTAWNSYYVKLIHCNCGLPLHWIWSNKKMSNNEKADCICIINQSCALFRLPLTHYRNDSLCNNNTKFFTTQMRRLCKKIRNIINLPELIIDHISAFEPSFKEIIQELYTDLYSLDRNDQFYECVKCYNTNRKHNNT